MFNENLLNETRPIYNHEEAIELALKTWYPPNHPLHSCSHHPLGKLLGEWGELLDDYMKGEYKPGYQFEPEDELGDIWYYLRVLCYQKNNHEPIEGYDWLYCSGSDTTNTPTDYIIGCAINEASYALLHWHNHKHWGVDTLDYIYSALLEISKRYNLTLNDLTQANWEKLKPGSKRGEEWMKARAG